MSRAPLKRVFGELDDSSDPSSSSPAFPTAKRRAVSSSDVSSDVFDTPTPRTPSDSPTNPFGKFRPSKSRALPRAIPVDDHLILRFQLLTSNGRDVHRIATVPINYTFWYLSKLIQFLFGWKSVRMERSPYDRHAKVERKAAHIFSIQKDIVMFTAAQRAGIVKKGRTVAYIVGDESRGVQLKKDEVRVEREEKFSLQHLWTRRGASSKAVIYDYDYMCPSRRELVHITMCGDQEKVSAHCFDSLSNRPYVLKGVGLPNDDDDDEDLALDLLQWNEPNAFEDFLVKTSGDGVFSEDVNEEDLKRRIAEEQAKVKERLMAPLPKRLPLDVDKEPEIASAEKDKHGHVKRHVEKRIEMIDNETEI